MSVGSGQPPPAWDEVPRTGAPRPGRVPYRPGLDPAAGHGDGAALAQARRAALREREALRQQRPLVWPPPESSADRGKPAKKKRGILGRRKVSPGEDARPLAPPEVHYEPAGAQGPLPAYANFDARRQASAAVRGGPAAAFIIEAGTVEPIGAKRRRGSALAGGRWRRSVLMTAMLLALSLLVVNGLYRLAGKALYDLPQPPAGSGFPAVAASGYAARFGQAYLTWDETTPQYRAEALRVFFPNARDTDLGWDGVGRQSLLGAPVVAGVTAQDDSHGVVHLAAFLVPGGWTCMDVAVYAAAGGTAFAITSYVAFIACPPAAAAQLSAPVGDGESDRAFAEQVRQTIESFLKAYAASAPELSQSTTEDSAISGLRGVVSFVELAKLVTPVVQDPSAEVRRADIKVRWRLPSGGTLLQGYRLTLRQIGGRWFVQRIDGGVEDADVAPKQGGVPPPSPRSSTTNTSTTRGTPTVSSSAGLPVTRNTSGPTSIP